MAAILVVDDRPINRHVLIAILKRVGHSILEASDGAAALAIVRAQHPDLVITDILMPTMDGFEFTQRVRADAAISATPIMFYTATYRAPEARTMAALCGVATVLPKPCDPKTLLDCVHRELGLEPAAVTEKLPEFPGRPKLGRLDDKFETFAAELRRLKRQFETAIDGMGDNAAACSSVVEAWTETTGAFMNLHRFSMRLAALIETTLDAVPDQGASHVGWFFFEAACKIIGCSYAALGLLDSSGAKYEKVYAKGFDSALYDDATLRSAALPAEFLRDPHLRHIKNPLGIPGLPVGHPPVRDLIGAPVSSREWQYGWVYFADRTDGNAFTDEDKRVAAMVISELAVFYESAMLYDLIQRHAAQLQVEVVRRKDAEEVALQREKQLSQSQKMEAVGQLTGGIAHDFNNLLTVIRANAEDLRDELAATPALAGQAGMVLQAVDRGADLVKQLLAFSRKQNLKPEVVKVSDVVHAFAALLKRTFQANITLETVAKADDTFINVDPGSLENALLNLSINARDAMPDGGKLIISVDEQKIDVPMAQSGFSIESGSYARIVVEDTGSGMPPDVIARAFEPFFTTKDVGKGSGLGLSMVYGFVKQSGGYAMIESEVGRGTRISILLPRVASQAKAEAAPAAAPAKAAGAAKILLVEDDDLVRQSVETKLMRLGYAVTAVASADAAIATLEHKAEFDLVFTDVIMPGSMTGADLARKVRERWPAINVLATSGYTESTLLGKVKIPAGVMLLSKPYTNADLAQAVGKAVTAANA